MKRILQILNLFLLFVSCNTNTTVVNYNYRNLPVCTLRIPKGYEEWIVMSEHEREQQALFEETYHALDIDKGKIILGQQTAMDEARAWQFAATAPGTKDITTEEGVSVYSAAYTIKNMPTKWVAKMLKEGCDQIPLLDWRGEDGTIYRNAVYGTLIQGCPYYYLEYGKSYCLGNKNNLQNFGFLDSLCFEPKDLKYNRKKQLVLKTNRKKPFSGRVEGEIVFSIIVDNMLMHNKENRSFYDKFGGYCLLYGQACFYEPDMARIAIGPGIFVKGQVVQGKEEGRWKYRYIQNDLDFLFMTANYKNGKLEGTVKFYKPDGRLYQRLNFRKENLF